MMERRQCPASTANAAISADLLSMALELASRAATRTLVIATTTPLLGGDADAKACGRPITAHAFRQTLQVSEADRRSGTAATTSCSTRRSICSTTRYFEPKMVVGAGHPRRCRKSSTTRAKRQLMDVLRQLHGRCRAQRSKTSWTPRSTATAPLNGGKQVTGLATAIPIVTNTGVYGGIDRAGGQRDVADVRPVRRQRGAVHARSARR